jgi:predicted secreted protein
VGLPLLAASFSGDIRHSVGDRNFAERNPEAALGAVDRSCPVNFGRKRTLLRATARSGCSCGVFQLNSIQRQLSLLGLDCADCVSGDQDNLVDTIQCAWRPRLGHDFVPLLHRDASSLPRRKHHDTFLHVFFLHIGGTVGRRQCVSLPASERGC